MEEASVRVLPMSVRRIVAYAGGRELDASRDFYVEVLGMEVAMEDPVLDLRSPDNPTAQVVIDAQEMQGPQPSFGVDVGEPAAVDAAHAQVLETRTAGRLPAHRRAVGRAALLRRGSRRHDRQRARAHRLEVPADLAAVLAGHVVIVVGPEISGDGPAVPREAPVPPRRREPERLAVRLAGHAPGGLAGSGRGPDVGEIDVRRSACSGTGRAPACTRGALHPRATSRPGLRSTRFRRAPRGCVSSDPTVAPAPTTRRRRRLAS